jgi:hypothetical protein
MGIVAINKQDPVAALGFVLSEPVKVFQPVSSDFSISPTFPIDHLCIVYFISTTTEHDVSAYLLASYIHTAGPVRPSPATACT